MAPDPGGDRLNFNEAVAAGGVGWSGYSWSGQGGRVTFCRLNNATVQSGEPNLGSYDQSMWWVWTPNATRPHVGDLKFSARIQSPAGWIPGDIVMNLYGSLKPKTTVGYADITLIATSTEVTITEPGGWYPTGSLALRVSTTTTSPTAPWPFYYLQVLKSSTRPNYYYDLDTTSPKAKPSTMGIDLDLKAQRYDDLSIGLKLDDISGYRNDMVMDLTMDDLLEARRSDFIMDLTAMFGPTTAQSTAASGDGGGIGIATSAELTVTAPPQLPAALVIRPMPLTVVTMPDVPIINGYPKTPWVWVREDQDVTLHTGAGHIRAVADPDPAAPGGSWSGLVTPTYFWTVRDLATPDDSGYLLDSWPEHGSGPDWQSEWDYRPRVRQRVSFGKGNKTHTYSKTVNFNPTKCQHMWIDLGSQSQPYTWIFCGIILSYPTRTFGHYLIDGGKKPSTHWNADDDVQMNDHLSHRSLMLFQRSSALIFTDQVVESHDPHVRVNHNYVPRPRMMYGVFNGSSSRVGWRDPAQHMSKVGHVSNHAHRYWVTGRRNNNISDNLSSHITLFEIRFFSDALTPAQLSAQYKQLAATYHFSLYGKG